MLESTAWSFSVFLNGDIAMTVGSSEWLPRTWDASFPVGVCSAAEYELLNPLGLVYRRLEKEFRSQLFP
ncbi:MAG: hypothetical protein U9Q79_04325 [Candidatus Hydrogenedentes bacterium]|nr:hypothetical protein [Candidatus Hydrogenedentota bacterium]